MALTYEVFGPCAPQVSTGAAGAYQALGEAIEGGNIAFRSGRFEIRRDGAGDMPADLQTLGSTATIDFELSSIDNEVLDKLLMAAEGVSVLGDGGVPGTLLGGGGFLRSLYLPSATTRPWVFPFCVIDTDGFQANYGTRSKPKRLRFFAFRYLPPTVASVATVKLFTRTAP